MNKKGGSIPRRLEPSRHLGVIEKRPRVTVVYVVDR